MNFITIAIVFGPTDPSEPPARVNFGLQPGREMDEREYNEVEVGAVYGNVRCLGN